MTRCPSIALLLSLTALTVTGQVALGQTATPTPSPTRISESHTGVYYILPNVGGGTPTPTPRQEGDTFASISDFVDQMEQVDTGVRPAVGVLLPGEE